MNASSNQIAAIKGIGIPKTGKFLLVASGILDLRIRNPAQGIRNPAQGIGNPAQGIRNPAQGIGNPAQGIGNPAQEIWNPAQEIWNPAQGIRIQLKEFGIPLTTGIQNPSCTDEDWNPES